MLKHETVDHWLVSFSEGYHTIKSKSYDKLEITRNNDSGKMWLSGQFHSGAARFGRELSADEAREIIQALVEAFKITPFAG